MCSISLQEIMRDRTYPQSGDVLYELMKDNINTSDRVIIDMVGVTALPSIFLNVSFGRLIDEFGADKVRSKVFFINISSTQANRVIDYVNKISKS